MRRYHYLLILFLTFTFLHGSAQSNIQWAIGLGNGKASNAYNTKLVFDSQKNVYMMGRYTDSTDFDPSLASMKKLVGDGISPFIAKYDVSGNYKWVKAIKYTYPNFIEISDILMDSHDEFYIYGSFAGAIDFDPSGNSDTLRTDTLLQGNCFIAKYDASGNYLWAKQLNYLGINAPFKMTLDRYDNFYLTAGINGTLNGPRTIDLDFSSGVYNLTSDSSCFWIGNAFLAKYDRFANFKWAKKFEDCFSSFAPSFTTASNNMDNLYIAGIKDTTTSSPSLILKYDLDGNLLLKTTTGPFYETDYISKIICDSIGNIAVSGYYSDPPNYIQCFLSEFNVNGTLLWTKKINMIPDWNIFHPGIRGFVPQYFSNNMLTVSAVYRGEIDIDSDTTKFLTKHFSGAFVEQLDSKGNLVSAIDLQAGETDYPMVANACLYTEPFFDPDHTLYIAGAQSLPLDMDPGPGTFYVHNTLFPEKFDAIIENSLIKYAFPAQTICPVAGDLAILNDTVCEGSNAVFSTHSIQNFSNCQWQENNGSGWVNLPEGAQYMGVNSNTLRIVAVTQNMQGYKYRCQLLDAACSEKISNEVTLYINLLPEIHLENELWPKNYFSGDSIRLGIAPSAAMTYEWWTHSLYKVPNADSSYYFPPAGAEYSLKVRNKLTGCVNTSPLIHLNSIVAPVLDVTKCNEQKTLIYIKTKNIYNFGPTCTWQENSGNGWVTVPSLPNDTLIFDTLSVKMNNYQYRCIANLWTAQIYADTSNVATLKVGKCDVWPGDANNDYLVDNTDLLPIGLYHAQTGTSRSSISNNWLGYESKDWGIEQANTNHADLKHADCNGDGTIDDNDTLAIQLNFNATHSFLPIIDQKKSTVGDLYFTSAKTSYTGGDWVTIDVMLGSATTTITGLYGIAFTINYDAAFVQPGTEDINYTNGWLGTPGSNVIRFAKTVPASKLMYGAVTRIDHINANGAGKIATLHFQLKSSITSANKLNFSIANYVANNNTGTLLYFTPQPYSVEVIPTTVSVDDIEQKNKFMIFPNPYSGKTTISYTLNKKENVTIEIYNTVGQKIETLINGNQQEGNYSYTFSALEKNYDAGMYFINVKIDEHSNMYKIVEMK
jgi:hypothetical protein